MNGDYVKDTPKGRLFSPFPENQKFFSSTLDFERKRSFMSQPFCLSTATRLQGYFLGQMNDFSVAII